MTIYYNVSVRIGHDEFIKSFDDEARALKCFDSLSVDTETAIEGNWATRESKSRVDTATIRRIVTPDRLGDPNR